ncbi:gastrula zinc finger protein XlCGF57.1 [Octopus bimaculoides]|uniref:C2H2-type domain-containing protein n=1 Tax=Octopus bimaculoides TaxID=37653 RepID=A0A0L8FJY3_OCTBM|nr:gastrula zinc finger protein XlCGF57.1 [Octopus bimaculoides]|eukprot:XP_014789146.1 PREDICTED: gastrula zinc finger protein XlCGF57.1-like [Octopus bimaculoides]
MTVTDCKDGCSKHHSTPSFQIKKVLKIGDNDKQISEKSSDNCTICGNDFFERASIMMLSKSNVENKEYECELCGKSYPLFSSLSQHVETHIGEKLHRCEVCGKDFFKSCGLEAHMKTHTGERPFHCDICSLDFACVFTLEMHTKTQHTDEKPFHCELCGKDFVLRTNLKMHIKMHMGEKLCNCKVCKKNFLINSLLENHLQNQKQQQKERPFYYELRGKDFTIRMHFVLKMSGSKNCGGDKLQMNHDKCKIEIPYKVTLQIQIQNPNGEKAFHSSVCGKDPTIDTQLREHTPKKSLHFVKCIRKVLRQIPFHHNTPQEKK